jgi:hypothetical protein
MACGTELCRTRGTELSLPGKQGRLASLDVYKYVMVLHIKLHHVPSSSISLIIPSEMSGKVTCVPH